jgi:hypothetical protein
MSGDLPADLDLGLRAHGPRSELVHVARLPQSKRRALAHLVDEVGRLVETDEISLPQERVRRHGPHQTTQELPARSFLTETQTLLTPLVPDLFEPEALVSRLNRPEYTVICQPPGLLEPKLPNCEVHASARNVTVRVDVSRNLRPEHVGMFVRRAEPADYVAPSVDDFN